MTEYTGRGEARRSIELLWGLRRPPSRGPKPGLRVEDVVAAAVALADAEGLEAVSMRRIGESLGVAPMSLYTYVPSKAELLDLMIDWVYGEQADALDALVAAQPGTRKGARAWRAGLEAAARISWDLAERHPWTAQVSAARSVLGPNETRGLDRMLALLADTGLRGRDQVAIVDVIALFVGGMARRAVEIREAPRRTGKTDDEWWNERAPLLENLYGPDQFPHLVAVAQDGGFDAPPGSVDYLMQFLVDDFEFGLQRLLDGIEAYIEAGGTRR